MSMKVKFSPQNVEFEIKPGQSVLHLAQDHGIYVKSVCKGVPSCAECRVRVVEGEHNVLPPGSEELSLIGSGHFIDRRRLSCQLKCFGDIVVDMTEQIAKEQGLIGGRKTKKLLIKDDRVEEAVARRSDADDEPDEEAKSERSRERDRGNRGSQQGQQREPRELREPRVPREARHKKPSEGEPGHPLTHIPPKAGDVLPEDSTAQGTSASHDVGHPNKKRRRRRRGGGGGGGQGGGQNGGGPSGKPQNRGPQGPKN